jgi:hypothetical protein
MSADLSPDCGRFQLHFWCFLGKFGYRHPAFAIAIGS